jgi:hypothetical protein
MLYLCKGYMPLSTCKNIWLQRLVLHQCPNVVFLFHNTLVQKMIHVMVKKTTDLQMLPNLASTTILTASFDL